MHPRRVLSLGNFFSSIHIFLLVYVLTPYLATFLPDDQVGLVVSAGAVGTLLAFPLMPRLIGRYGARVSAIGMASVIAVALLLLAHQPPLWLALLSLAFICASTPFIQYFLDLLLEAVSTEHGEVGRIRTAYITAGNIALICAPLAIGLLLGNTSEYWRVFFAGALSLAPFITLFLYEKLPEQKPLDHVKLLDSCRCVLNDTDLRAAAYANGVLQFFFHLAPLYVPLYLHNVLGMPWSELGWIFAIMLLPFVFIEYPAGYIADKWLGDKEMLIAGFIITGISFAALAYVSVSTPFWFLMLALVGSRVGAALVEAMVEGHFFRRVSAEDANTVSLYRMTRPISALAAPITASIVLALTHSYAFFFVSMGAVIVITGVGSALFIRDVR